MKLFLHKQLAYQLFFIIGGVTFYPKPVLAQDTLALKEVDIIAKKITLSKIGKKTEDIDSTIKQQFKFSSIADVMSLNSTVFIKSYGPGGLATSAFRGGNASQTAILWNGFNIQNAMLGQIDLNLLPSVLFDNIEVEYGGSSSNWGSGAVGGSIHLNNNLKFNKGFFTAINASSGNFGLFNLSTQINYSTQRFICATKIYTNQSKNNFKYKDTADKENPIKEAQHNAYKFYGLLQELKFIITPKQQLTINAWLASNNRELLGAKSNLISKQYQYDMSSRFTANWNYVASRYSSNIRGAYFNDKLNYTDSAVPIFSKSKVQSFILENEHFYKWFYNQQLNFGINATTNTAYTNNYESTKSLSKLSFLLGNKSDYFNAKLIVYSLARFEYYSNKLIPFTGNISATYFLGKNITTKINIAKLFRVPTLNELYWQPGGNINLKPEQGFTFEGELDYKKQFKTILVSVSGAAFSRTIDNWILWVPGRNGSSQPINVQKVWSRGTETNWKIKYKKNNFTTSATISTAYILSSVQHNHQENNNTTNKQLIYTPRYTVNGNFSIGYANFILSLYQQYIGYRFITSDNLQWLKPYHYSTLRLNTTLNTHKNCLIIFVACNNMFNTNYTIIANSPMPLRNYEIGISIQYKKNK